MLLDRHSRLAITPETHFFSIVPAHPPAAITHGELLDQLFSIKQVAELHLDRDALAAEFLRRSPTYADLLQCTLSHYATMHGKPLAGEKTPHHLLHVPTILEWFPQATILCIVRDGRDVVLSLRNMQWNPEKDLRKLSRQWVRLLKLSLDFEQRFPRNFLIVRYEDLLAAPEPTMQRLHAFINLPFEPRQLEPAPSDVVPAWTMEWKADALKELDASRIGAWRTNSSPREQVVMNAIMAPWLKRMGYPATALPLVSRILVALGGFMGIPRHPIRTSPSFRR